MIGTISKHVDYADFPIGTRVRVVSECVDFSFFNHDTGAVIENKGRYLGIIVRFDADRWYRQCNDGKGCEIKAHHDIRSPFIFNFEPRNLVIEGEAVEHATKLDDEPIFGMRR